MIDRRDMAVVQIPIDEISVVNPRTRSQVKFRQIVSNISAIGLKKPVTVVRRAENQYDLVCGQGRLEACRSLGESTVPAFVVDASREELLLMSLAENLARRQYTSVAMLREIGLLKDRGYSYAQICKKTDLTDSYVRGIVRLLKHGEERLLREVEKARIPISIAITIATAKDEDVQRALAEAYENQTLRGKELLRARKVIEMRRLEAAPTHPRRKPAASAGDNEKLSPQEVTREKLLQAYRRETSKQRLLVQKARICETRLLFIRSALQQLLADPGFVAILKTAGLDQIPQSLCAEVRRKRA